jgi:hypothetical protein
MRVDQAWQLHTGTPNTVIAVLDSGIRWDHNDLVDRHYLNQGELPKPEGSTKYDANGDGRFSVSDYLNDSRVSDVNSNGHLDGGDLITIFSDSVDDDGNGYVDDIAGWDFHEMDNNPGDRIEFGHGTAEALDSVGAINNGKGAAGICGNCSFMALRVDDSFIVDATAFAAAIHYALDRKVDLVQQALGSANANPAVQASIERAYQEDVVIIGSAADENSYHHNYPSTFDPVIYTNAIRYDTRDKLDATTFVNFTNCSNFGARVDVATSGVSCSSEATANLSGITALTISYAKSLGISLKAGELISLIKSSATDINLGEADPNSERHSTFEGWDMMTGYGRSDALTMLTAVKQGRIPPEARIVSPGWFEFFREDTLNELEVTFNDHIPRGNGDRTLRLEIAHGVETVDTQFKTVYQVKGPATNSLTKKSILTSDILALPRNPRVATRNEFAYTLRLTIENDGGLKAESRRTFFMQPQDQLRDLKDGFPVRLEASGESSGVFVDLDGDGSDEYVMGDGGGTIHAFTASGQELAGFPVMGINSRYQHQLPSSSGAGFYAALAVGDITGDGRVEIVGTTFEGHVVVLSYQGKPLKGFPKTLPLPDMSDVSKKQIIAKGIGAAPVIVDLNNDGVDDIVVVSMNGHVYAYQGDGTYVEGFPVAIEVDGIKARIMSSPAVADVDGDQTPDLIFGTNHLGDASGYLFALSGKGTKAKSQMLAGFPRKIPLIKDRILPTIGTGIPTAPVIADFDGDGEREIMVHAFVGKAYLVGFDGSLKRSLTLNVSSRHETNDEFMIPALGHPAVGDLDGDGVLDPVTVGVGKRMLVNMLLGGKRYPYNHMVGSWNGRTGDMIEGYPKALTDAALVTAPLIADLNDDGRNEVVSGNGGYFIQAWDHRGVLSGFPKFMGGWAFGAPSLGDMDGDGFLELAVTTREGYLFVWDTDGRVGQTRMWSTFKGNGQRTGRL